MKTDDLGPRTDLVAIIEGVLLKEDHSARAIAEAIEQEFDVTGRDTPMVPAKPFSPDNGRRW